jgi:hypothetical protein
LYTLDVVSRRVVVDEGVDDEEEDKSVTCSQTWKKKYTVTTVLGEDQGL